MNVRVDCRLEFCRNRFRFAQGLMEIFRFFIAISPILLILRISTGQRFRKERAGHDACMGWILEESAGLNSVQTVSDLHKGSWTFEVFHSIFADFADSEDVNFCGWMTEKRRFLGQNGTNAWAVWVEIMRTKS